jgi:hypothetical protein
MRNLGAHLLFVTLLIAFCSSAGAQHQVDDLDTWLIRATSVTDDLTKDAISLAPNDRALLWARIGKAWVKDDPERAATSIKRAVEIVEFVPDQESDAERRQRLHTAKALFDIIPSQETKLRLRLEALFTSGQNRSTARRVESAEGMIAAAVAVVDSNPQRALDLGARSLQVAKSYKLAFLLWKLRKREPRLADVLFDHALAVTKTTYDAESLSWLGQYAFNGQTPSDERRRALLGVMAEGLLRNSTSPSGQREVCQLSETVASRLDEFARLLPLHWGSVRAAVQRCQALVPAFSRETVENALRERPLKSIDELESEADTASSEETRDEYLTRAARLAAQHNDFERGISILDRISDRGRKALDGWDNWRQEFASFAAASHLRAGNRSAMHKVIAATPSRLRAYVQIALARALLEASDRDSAFELLSAARQGLAESTGQEVINSYFSLLNHYENLMPVETLSVLNEAVKAINRSEKSDPKPSAGLQSETLLSNDILVRQYKLPLTLMERDELGIRGAISSVEPATTRAAMRLNLIEASLERHRTITPRAKPLR